ncbi:MAG: TonB-dependent receptor [Rhodocyclaceae bacterium]|nr:TonB-dependent receptor [Rhodocyclaceae bacterium]
MLVRSRNLHRGLCAAIAAGLFSVTAHASDLALDIAPQNLDSALRLLARQANVQILFAADLVAGHRAPALKGSYAPEAALRALLAGSGLEFRTNGDGTFALRAPPGGRDGEPHGHLLGAITVTAQQRKQREIDVPIAINTLRADEIESRGITDLQSLALAVPGMTAVVTGMAQNRVMLRGIGEGAGGGNLPLVGIQLDDVAIDGPLRGGLDVRPLDVERVEVLNGPQGTLYGQGSMGGTVRFLTRDPIVGKTSLTTTADVWNTDGGSLSHRLTGVANLPLGDRSALRVAGTFERVGGWIDAPTAGQRNINDGEFSQIRVKGLFHLTDRLSLIPMVQIHRNDVGSLNHGENADGDLVLPAFAPNAVQSASNSHELYSLTADWELADGVRLLAVGSMFRNDSDGGYYSTTPNGLIGVLSRFDNRDKARSGELRLMSDDAGRWQWTVGTLYRDVDYSQTVSSYQMGLINSPTPLPVPGTRSVTPVKSKSWSFYGNTSFDLTERLQLGGGLRYFTDEQTAPTAGQSGQRFDSVDPRVYASFKLMRDWNVYASAAKGFRSGGFNAVNPAFPGSFKSESVWSYEIGTKFEAMGGMLGGQIAGFMSRYTDMQTATLGVAPNVFYTDNIGRAHIKGIDWSFRVRPADWITFGASGTVQDTEVVSVKANSAYAVGDRLNYIPKSNYALFAETQANLANDVKARLRVDYNVRGSSILFQRTYDAIAENDKLKLLNMRFSLSRKQYGIELYGENLLNERGQIAPTPVNFATRTVPRTIGIRGTASF